MVFATAPVAAATQHQKDIWATLLPVFLLLSTDPSFRTWLQMHLEPTVIGEAGYVGMT